MEKKASFMSRYVTFCGKVYDFFDTCCHGQRKHTPETLKISQKRGTWIVSLSLFFVLAVIGAFTDEEEQNNTLEAAEEAEVVEDSETPKASAKVVQESSPAKAIQKSSNTSWRPKPIISVYVCAKCATVVTGPSQPRPVKCPNSNSSHQWDNIGLKGDTNYQCGKCGVTISSQPTPKPGRCPRGLGHHWGSL
jgi:DNA-directed RNA polymerase subunit RPC12/RpoP